MEQRSRAQKYQQLRQNLAVETENTVKSRDLSRYARQMESFKTPATQEFQYEKQEPVVGTRNRAASEYLNEIQKESDAIDEIVRANEELMNETPVSKPAVASRAQRFASMFMVDEDEELVVAQPKVEEVKVEEIVEELAEVLPVEEVVEEVFEEETIEEPVVEEVFEEETVEEPAVEEVFEEIFEETTVEEVVEEPTVEKVFEELVEETLEEVEEDFDIDSYEEEPVIKDHFMDDILLEAKKYSVDMGQRAAIDTTATILSELTQSEQEPVAFELEETADDSFDLEFAAEIEGLLNDSTTENVEEAEVVEEPEELQAQIEAIINDNITAPFFEEDEEVEEVKLEEEVVEEVEEVVEDTQNNSIISHEIERDDYMELTMKLDQERIFREEMMQKTKQMKLQLDEYETELNTVSNKVSHTNMVLNFVLILLILALFCLLGFIAYWALVDRGLIGAVELENAFETFAMFVGNWL